MTFTIQPLTNERALVSGTDVTGTEGKVVVSTSQWDAIKAHQGYTQATEDFDAEVEAFFAPLNAAIEKVAAAKLGNQVDDPSAYVVLHDEVEGVQARPAVVETLNKDSVVLRLIEEGRSERLIWVNDELEVLAVTTEAQGQANVEEILGAIEVGSEEKHDLEG